MVHKIGIGHQDFARIREEDFFYIDKTPFIQEWWERGDHVTLITRPRRFGKTLAVSMIETFFSVRYAGRGDLFQGLNVWNDKKYHNLQGTYPVLFISFADVKENSFSQTRKKICRIIKDEYNRYSFLLNSGLLNESEKEDFQKIAVDMDDSEASHSLKALSDYLFRYYKKRVIILIDEYDTPMQEAYINGYWEPLVLFIRGLFNGTLKTNPYLERAVMTGITRVSRESMFSDLNNVKVITTTSEEYRECFGFTENEVYQALKAFGLDHKMQEVKNWYDGFTFGSCADIYNPWSIVNYLDTGRLDTYWANTSSNELAGKFIREGSRALKQDFEELLCGRNLTARIDEQIVYSQLPIKKNAIWSLLLASGYLKVVSSRLIEQAGYREYILALTNKEVQMMFESMVHDWFTVNEDAYNDFVKALLSGDLTAMNAYMNQVVMDMFSYFDSGNRPSKEEPEKFYHGFVLGLLIELKDRYILTSNRESGFGRYDIMLEPKKKADDGMILEFKVQDTAKEKKLSDTVNAALEQIKKKKYDAVLIEKGIPAEKIRRYGFAFCGKKVLIGDENSLSPKAEL